MLESLERPFDVDGREVFVGASVGISAGITDGEDLLRDADLAMYRAKEPEASRYEAFAPEMHTAMVDRLDLEVDLKRAIPGDELELHYQPIFSLESGAIAGMEALVRWNHPTRGLVPPARFIPLAEASGMVHDLGRWTLNAACHQGALWRARYPAAPGIQIDVNVSASQLARAGRRRRTSPALEQAQLEPDALTLEVTETALMSDIDAAVARLRSLKDLGVRIAIDDFGVGHASLRYLKRFPLDYLKVAKDFVDEIDTPGEELAILRAIIDLSRVFGLSAIAEGIETEEQRLKLGELGCEFGQGYLLSRPAPAKAADDLILQVGLLGGRPDRSRAGRQRPGDGSRDVPQPRRVASSPSCGELIRTSSPGWSQTRGSRVLPTPDGVPVEIRSPGSSVISAERCGDELRAPRRSGRPSSCACICSPFRVSEKSIASWETSSAVTSAGPQGAEPSKILPAIHCGVANCRSRAERSFSSV